MASGVEELLDMLFEMIDEAKNAPLSSDKCIVERDRALDLIDDIRSQFPMELTEARKMIALQARQRANDMMRQAEERSRELKRSANEYCEDALRRTEEAVSEAYNEIKQSRSRFRAAAAATAGGAPAGRGAVPQPGASGGSPRSVYDADRD